MEGFKFKLHTEDIQFELDIDNLNKEEDIEFVREILKMVDRKSATMVEKVYREEMKDKVKEVAKGYKEMAKESINFSNGVDEYMYQEIENELKQESGSSSPATEDNGQKEELKKIEVMEKVEEIEQPKEENTPNRSNVINLPNGYKLKYPNDASIRINTAGEDEYQTYYICSDQRCKHRGKRYVRQNTIYTYCHQCNKKLKIKIASLKGFPNKDAFGNIFVAGDFVVTLDTQIKVAH